jgi:hypothetical protein
MARRMVEFKKLLANANITLGVVRSWNPPVEVVRFCEVVMNMKENTTFTTRHLTAIKENTNEGDWFLLKLFQHIDGREGFGLKHKKAIAKEACSPSALMELIGEMVDDMNTNDLFEIIVCLDFRRHEHGLFLSRVVGQFHESAPDLFHWRFSPGQRSQIAKLAGGSLSLPEEEPPDTEEEVTEQPPVRRPYQS